MNKIVIAKDGYPVELIENRPITNFFRKLIHGRVRMDKDKYEHIEKQRAKVRSNEPLAQCCYTHSHHTRGRSMKMIYE